MAGVVPVSKPLAPLAENEAAERAAGYLVEDRLVPDSNYSATDPAAFARMLNSFGPGWVVSDGTLSVKLPDGRVAWFFGDTVMGAANLDGTQPPGNRWAHNTIGIQQGNVFSTLSRGPSSDINTNSTLAPNDGTGAYYWPRRAFVDANGDLEVFMGRVKEIPGGTPGWNFTGDGTDMLTLDAKSMAVKSRINVGSKDQVEWGTDAYFEDGFEYIYGNKGDQAFLARVPAGATTDRAQWTYYSNGSWSADQNAASVVSTSVGGVLNVVRTPDGRYAMLSQPMAYFSRDITIRKSSTLWGPWSKPEVLYTIPNPGGQRFAYGGFVHSQFNAGGKMLLSYNVNTFDLSELGRDVSSYRPRFVALDMLAAAGGERVSTAMTPTGKGYWMVAADGSQAAFGDAKHLGDMDGQTLKQPVVGTAATPSGNGYWMVAGDGGVFSFGDAQFYGSTGGIKLNQPIVGMAPTKSGKGYWMVAKDGGIFSFGDAKFHGSAGGVKLNQPIVGMAPTPSGKGYWMVASDGGIFSFGDAGFHGSTGSIKLNKPIVGMAPTPSGKGYWMVASDGGVFCFGDAKFHGSTGSIKLNQPIIGMQAMPDGNGYRLIAKDGGIFSFGNAPFAGSLAG